ncbi:hypothetical protein FHU33_3361 [Blastococcus colisei]|uniref:Uncharacterized protein n=1 Tax=Blastococcus colisei TaxID=1564162 RepID=A0A543PIK9_9ACTN|nr:hypothetical protein FHU33_3361 [Blastococcus colisei]
MAPGPPHEAVEGARPVVGRRQGARRDDSHLAPSQSAGQTTDVVGVQVGDEHHRQRVDAEPVETAVHRADVGPGVDEHPGAGTGGQHEGIALADVAGHDQRAGRRPSNNDLAHRPADDEQPDDRGERERAQPPEPPQRPADGDQEHGQQRGTLRSGRPARRAVRHVRGASGDEDQPPRRPSGSPDQCIRHPGQHDPDHRREQPEDGGHRHRRRGEQVRRERDEADRPRQAGDDRRGHHSRGRADGHRIGEQSPAAALPEAARPSGCQQDDARGGRDGQRETRIPGQPGIEQEEHAHHRAQCRHGRPSTARRQRQQGHRAHGGGADDARFRTGQDDETGEREAGDHGLHPPVERSAAERPQHAGQHDGDVRPGHRGEVRQAGPAEVLLEHRVHRPGVSDDQTRQQAGGRGIQHALRGGCQGCPKTSGGPLQTPGTADQSRWPASGEHCDDLVPGVGQGDADPHACPLTREQLPPVVRGAEQHHVRLQQERRPPVLEARHGRVGDDARRPRAAQDVGVAVQFQDDRHGPRLLGGPSQG